MRTVFSKRILHSFILLLTIFVGVFFVNPYSSFATCREVRIGGVEAVPRIVCETETANGGTIRTETAPISGRTTETVIDREGNTSTTVTNQGAGGNLVEDVMSFFGNVALSAVLLPVVAISFVILTLASGLLWLAGTIFNWTVTVMVFQFAVYLGNTPGMLLAWSILRDFGNILLLFGFVYMGIQTILQIGHYSVGRALSRLVIFAILLNFSLFVAEAVIDASNVLAASMYNLAGSTSTSGGVCTGTVSECAINQGIASKVLDQAGIATVLGGAANTNVLSGIWNHITNPIGETLKYFMLAMLVTIMAVVLFAAAFLLISRGIHLAFLMVTAPVGFAGMAVPWLEKIAKDWWDQLIKQSLFAPVFLILLFVGLKIMEGVSTGIGGGSLVEALTTNGVNTGPIISFVMIIGFMIGAMLVAKQFGIYGAEAITKTALGAIKGVASYPFTPYRDFAGRQAENFAKRYNAASGRRMAGLDLWAKNSGLLGKIAKPVLSAAGSAIDDGVMSSVKGVKDFKVGSRSYADQKKHMEEREKDMADAERQAKQKKDLDDAMSSGDADKIERILQQMSTNDIKATSYIKESKDGIGEIARNLSTDKFAELINDKEVAEATKKKLMDERFLNLTEAFRNPATAATLAQPEVRRLSSKDLELLAKGKPEAFKKILETTNGGLDILSDAQIEHLEKSTALTNGQRQEVKQKTAVGRVDSNLKGTAGPGALNPTQLRDLMNIMKAKQKAKLSDEALTAAVNRNLLNPSDFAQVQARGEINDSTRRHIATHIATVRSGPAGPIKDAYEKYMGSTVAQGYWTP